MSKFIFLFFNQFTWKKKNTKISLPLGYYFSIRRSEASSEIEWQQSQTISGHSLVMRNISSYQHRNIQFYLCNS